MFCPEHLYEEIEGDLIQKFNKDIKSSYYSERSDDYRLRRAKRRLAWSALRFFRPGILLRNKYSIQLLQFMMWTNYLKTTVRMLGRNKTYSFINIFGLAIGIVSTILILLWVQFEYSYNSFAANHENIYQIKVNVNYDGEINTQDDNCIPVFTKLKNEDSQVKRICITSSTYGHSISFKEKKTNKEVMSVSEEFLDLFQIPLIEGDIRSLDGPYSIMLNESTAKELFGEADPVGQFVTLNNEQEWLVTGIFKDVPYNSTFWFHALISNYTQRGEWFLKDKDKWDNFYPRIYLELQPDVSPETFGFRIKDMVKKHFDDGTHPELFLQAMDRWYLYDNFVDGKEAGGKIEYVKLFTWIAILILLIACINYMNLATARSERRAKEVGIRKSIGSHRSELIQQFLIESFLVTAISFLIAMIAVSLYLPSYNNFVHARLAIDFTSSRFWFLVIGLFTVTGLLSGFYPAFYFSSLQPIKVLKGMTRSNGSGLLRKVMLTFQYVISVFLVIGMLVIYKQIQHAKDRELGYVQENLVLFAMNDQIEKNYNVIKTELLQSGVVEAVNRSNQGIDVDYFTDYVEWEGKQTEGKVVFTRISTDYDYIKTNGIKMLEGRDFSPDIKSDVSAVLINETAVRIMNMKNPIGRKIKIKDRELTIIGVMNDVLRTSPFDPVRPLFAAMLGDGNTHLSLRLSKTDNLSESLKRIDAIFRKLDPMNVDEVMFVDERFAYNFRTIELIGQLSNIFASLAILLTALGVFGLAAYTAEQRTKEMAIRKILGASLGSLLLLLSNYFVRIVFISVLIAAPVAWWIMNNYLKNYSYRIDIPWWTIPLTSLVIFALTLFIVFTQVARTASVNPVNSLKSE
jgi:putative ABC transport system permease protein